MRIRFKVNASGAIVEKVIYSYYIAKKFLHKVEHSKKLTLLSYGKLSW